MKKPTSVGRGVAVIGGVDDLARESAPPLRDERHVAVTRSHDHSLCLDHAVACMNDPASAVAVDSLGFDACPHVQRMALNVALEVLEDAVARKPLSKLAGNAVTGKAREPANGVQVQPVVTRLPGSADVVSLEHEDLLAQALELGGRGQSGRSGSDHRDHAAVLHHRIGD
jgi:hypothetical protein